MRVEPDETQDYVLKKFAYEDCSQREVDEIGFVPSALSEPRVAIHWCDGRCCDNGSRFNQIAKRAQSICVHCATMTCLHDAPRL